MIVWSRRLNHLTSFFQCGSLGDGNMLDELSFVSVRNFSLKSNNPFYNELFGLWSSFLAHSESLFRLFRLMGSQVFFEQTDESFSSHCAHRQASHFDQAAVLRRGKWKWKCSPKGNCESGISDQSGGKR